VKVLVTGSAGFIGTHAARAFRERGDAVLGVDLRRAPGSSVLDLRRPAAVERVVRRFAPDAIVHLGALASVPGCEADPEECVRTNVLGTLHVARAAGAIGARLVFASSAAVYGEGAPLPTPVSAPAEPTNLYGVSKAAGERVCRQHAEETVVLRLFNVYGEGCRRSYVIPDLIRRLSARPGLLSMDGTGREARDFVYVGDVIEAMERAVHGRFRGVYNVGSGRRTSLRALARRVAVAVGRAPVPVRFRGARPGDFRANHADISPPNGVPGWVPQVGLDEGLRRTVTGDATVLR
jgi:UDP-glucose 4-epimerase